MTLHNRTTFEVLIVFDGADGLQMPGANIFLSKNHHITIIIRVTSTKPFLALAIVGKFFKFNIL